jgi:hypothetical protein
VVRGLQAFNKLLYSASLAEKLQLEAIEEHRLMQNNLCEYGSLKLVIKTLNNNSTLSQHPEAMLSAAAQVGIRLMGNCNSMTQDCLHAILEKDSSNTMFKMLVQQMNETTKTCRYFQSHPERSIGKAAKEMAEERYSLMLILMRLMISMVDGQHQTLSDYMRDQPGEIHSINLLEHSVLLFCNMLGDKKLMANSLDFPEVRLLESVVTFLTEAVEGPNYANQDLLASGPIVRIICELLTVEMCKVRECKVRDSSGRRQDGLFADETYARTEPLSLKCSAKALKSKCVRFLCALTEGVTDKQALNKICHTVDVSSLSERLTQLYLMQNYLSRNPTCASETQLQMLLNASPGEKWHIENCTEGENIVILLKVLSGANTDVAREIQVDATHLWKDPSLFRSHYDAGMKVFFDMQDQLEELREFDGGNKTRKKRRLSSIIMLKGTPGKSMYVQYYQQHTWCYQHTPTTHMHISSLSLCHHTIITTLIGHVHFSHPPLALLSERTVAEDWHSLFIVSPTPLTHAPT